MKNITKKIKEYYLAKDCDKFYKKFEGYQLIKVDGDIIKLQRNIKSYEMVTFMYNQVGYVNGYLDVFDKVSKKVYQMKLIGNYKIVYHSHLNLLEIINEEI